MHMSGGEGTDNCSSFEQGARTLSSTTLEMLGAS